MNLAGLARIANKNNAPRVKIDCKTCLKGLTPRDSIGNGFNLVVIK